MILCAHIAWKMFCEIEAMCTRWCCRLVGGATECEATACCSALFPHGCKKSPDNLLANEWVYLEGDWLDARRKFIRTRPKLIEALQEVLDQLNVDEEPS